MKFLTIIGLLFTYSLSLHASSVEIYKLEQTDRDRVFNLINSDPDTKIILDCASFIHQLTVNDIIDRYTYNLTVRDCNKAYKYLRELPSVRKCLEYDHKRIYFYHCP